MDVGFFSMLLWFSFYHKKRFNRRIIKKVKKLLGTVLCVVLVIAFSTSAFAQESNIEKGVALEQSTTANFENIIDGGNLNARQSINVYLKAGQGITYTVYTPSIFDVHINFSLAGNRFAVQVDDQTGMVMQKIFNNQTTPISYVDSRGYYSNGAMKLLIFNDGSYDNYFIGNVNFVAH